MKKIPLFILILSHFFVNSKSQTLVQTFTEPGNKYTQTLFGISVALAGDVNNDGYDDMLVGAPNYDTYRGCAYLFLGGESCDDSADLEIIGHTCESWFGNSVSSAGDVNNDGYDDIIIGAHNESNGRGRVDIYYGGENLNNVPDVVIFGSEDYGHLGCKVSAAGDVNNDGYDDIIVGEKGYLYSLDIGRALIFLGGSNMDNRPDYIFMGSCSGENVGSYVSKAGDVNGDGYDDVIIGAEGDDFHYGVAYIIYGGVNMNRTPDVILNGRESGYGYACSVSGIGDFNKDGYDDVAVSSIRQNSNENGKVYIYFGSRDMDNTPNITMSGPEEGSRFGYSISGTGDLNQDGYDDVVIGADYLANYPGDAGFSFIYYGGEETIQNPGPVFTGKENSLEGFGYSVSANGDVNNDGFNDILIGAPDNSNTRGNVYLFYGGNENDSIAELILCARRGGTDFGNEVSNAGDVNGDGFEDMIVAAEYSNLVYLYLGGNVPDRKYDQKFPCITGWWNSNANVISRAGDCNHDGFADIIIRSATGWNIYFGDTDIDTVPDVTISANDEDQFSTAGDFNNDGYDDIIVGKAVYYGGESMDNIKDITLTTDLSTFYLGRAVSFAGDINNDGMDDIMVAAQNGLIENITDRVYIYFGGNDPDNVADLMLTNNDLGNAFGFTLSNAGDFNADGIDDIIVGSYLNNDGMGRVFLYRGGNDADDIADMIFEGEARDDQFGFAISHGDVNNDGKDDILIGANNKDSRKGRVYVYFGGEQADNLPDAMLDGEDLLSQFGCSVAASDMNHDGNDELIVGSKERLIDGAVYLFDFNTPKKSQSVIFEQLSPVTYGISSFALSGSTTSELPVQYESLNPDVASISWNTVTVNAAGSAIIRAYHPGNMVYDSAEVSQTLIVNKSLLNVIADDTSKVFGSDNPEFTMTFEGFVNYDNREDINVLPSVTTEANATTSPGTYSLIPAGGNDDDYDFNYITGTLSIFPETGIISEDTDIPVLMPNPAGLYVYIKSEKYIGEGLFIYNIAGEVLIQSKVELNPVDVSSLAPGIYFLKIKDDIFKFVKR